MNTNLEAVTVEIVENIRVSNMSNSEVEREIGETGNDAMEMSFGFFWCFGLRKKVLETAWLP